MNRHDPLPVIIDSLMESNKFEAELLPRVLQETQRSVKELRQKYREIPCNVDYGDQYVRGAYMLAYFPYYIEPVDTVLSRIRIAGTTPIPNKQQVSVCIFGSGPTPEALGVMAYLKENCPACSQAHFSLLDAAAEGWQGCTGLCFDKLQQHYWDGHSTYSLHQCNLLGQCHQCGEDCTAQLQHVDLVILQNCMNDIIANPEGAVAKVISIFHRMRTDAILVCIDLNFSAIRTALQAIATRANKERLGIVVHTISDEPHKITRSFNIPKAMQDHLFIGVDGLIERRYTKFYALALKRIR